MLGNAEYTYTSDKMLRRVLRKQCDVFVFSLLSLILNSCIGVLWIHTLIQVVFRSLSLVRTEEIHQSNF